MIGCFLPALPVCSPTTGNYGECCNNALKALFLSDSLQKSGRSKPSINETKPINMTKISRTNSGGEE
jgi:hypothetical protein